MGAFEVTQSQYQTIMGKNPSRFAAIGPLKDQLKGLNTSKFPVESLSFDETLEFCRRLGELEGRHYRLPTEAEWEYACRAGTSEPYSFGPSCNGNEANCNGNHPYGTKTKGPNLDRTTRVGSYPPNAFGLYDMHGNVWERCADWYSRDYDTEVRDDPPGSPIGSYRISRGGSWLTDPVGCRSASRYGYVPSYREIDVGFRVCLDVPTDAKPEPNADASSEAKPEATPQAKPETTPESKPDATPEPKPDATSEPKPAATSEPKAKANSDTKPKPSK